MSVKTARRAAQRIPLSLAMYQWQLHIRAFHLLARSCSATASMRLLVQIWQLGPHSISRIANSGLAPRTTIAVGAGTDSLTNSRFGSSNAGSHDLWSKNVKSRPERRLVETVICLDGGR